MMRFYIRFAILLMLLFGCVIVNATGSSDGRHILPSIPLIRPSLSPAFVLHQDPTSHDCHLQSRPNHAFSGRLKRKHIQRCRPASHNIHGRLQRESAMKMRSHDGIISQDCYTNYRSQRHGPRLLQLYSSVSSSASIGSDDARGMDADTVSKSSRTPFYSSGDDKMDHNLQTVSKTTKTNPWTIHDQDLLHRRYHPKYLRLRNNGSNSDTLADDVSDGVGGRCYDTDYDYIIIGSGIGGLWLGACLSKFGKSCLVLEQHDIAGGFQHTFKRGKYEFVPGLHYIANLQLCAPLYEMVAEMPSDLPPIRYPQSGNAVHADHGQSHTLQVGALPTMYVREGIDNVRDELLRVFPDETTAVNEFLRIMEKSKWLAGQFATFKIFPFWLQWILSQTMCSNYIHYASLTTEQVLDQLTNDGRLKTVLSAFGGDLGESLADGSFVMQAAVLGHVLEGCYYPESGPIHFVRGLVPTIRNKHTRRADGTSPTAGNDGGDGGGDVLVQARVKQILLEEQQDDQFSFLDFIRGKSKNRYRAVGVELANGDKIKSRHGVVSDAGIRTTLRKLLPAQIWDDDHQDTATNGVKELRSLLDSVEESSGGISHVFLFVGLNASTDELNLQSSSFYYIPWNTTTAQDMDATAIQDYYRDTLLDPNVLDVSAGMVFVTAKDPTYSQTTMPNRSTVIVFSEARAEDFDQFLVNTNEDGEGFQNHEKRNSSHPYPPKRRRLGRTKEYQQSKDLIKQKMMRSLLLNFPHLEPYIDFAEVGTPLTILDYTLRTETLGLRHTPQRMTDMKLRPRCSGVDDLYFTGQDVSFAGWAGALTGAMVTAQCILGYTLVDFAKRKTLMRDLGRGDVEDMIQNKVQEATEQSFVETIGEILANGMRNIQQRIRDPKR